ALYNMNMDQIILSCSKVNPMMNSVTTMVILGIVPFNLIKYGINCLITFAVYKKISAMIHRFANGQ
ncbi:MAG: ECF transporter S component, partial [Clostridium sp.]|nr:ECF transporter S component [Clostridium sp.]